MSPIIQQWLFSSRPTEVGKIFTLKGMFIPKSEEEENARERLFDRFNGGTITLEDYIDAIKHQTGL